MTSAHPQSPAQSPAQSPSKHPHLDIAAIGYGRPYLKYIKDHYPRMLNLETFKPPPDAPIETAPIETWPESPSADIRTAIVDETCLPMLDASFDLVLVAHCLEITDAQTDTIDECWRILKGQGRLILLVPHRSSMWASRDDTPFGLGQPFSNNQIRKLLTAHGFQVEHIHQALAAPPSKSALYQRYAPLVERMPNALSMGRGWGWGWGISWGGVLIVEAVKMVYAVRGEGKGLKKKTALKVGGRRAGATLLRSQGLCH